MSKNINIYKNPLVYNQKNVSTNLNILNRRVKSCVSGWDCFIRNFSKKTPNIVKPKFGYEKIFLINARKVEIFSRQNLNWK